MALAGFGHDLTDEELKAGAVKAARTILAGHAGCTCRLCELAVEIELKYTGVSNAR